MLKIEDDKVAIVGGNCCRRVCTSVNILYTECYVKSREARLIYKEGPLII